jgi:4'-phosphopantetheinyl transferase
MHLPSTIKRIHCEIQAHRVGFTGTVGRFGSGGIRLGEVHVWRIDLVSDARNFAALSATLSEGERDRAARFCSSELREQWTVAHGALRCILAAYSGSRPECLALATGPKGKPKLAGPCGGISFNLTHTTDLALVAIAVNRRVGIDAERIRPGIDVLRLSRCFFSACEADEVSRAPSGGSQLAAFFSCWTRKESFLKALGIGLSVPLNRFQVTIGAHEPARLVSVDWEEATQWTLIDLNETGVAAALTVEGSRPLVQRFQFGSANCWSNREEGSLGTRRAW